MNDLIVAEIHQALRKLGRFAEPRTPEEARRTLRDLGAHVDLRGIVDSWQDTLDDNQVLELLRAWNAGLGLFQTTYASNGAGVTTSYRLIARFMLANRRDRVHQVM